MAATSAANVMSKLKSSASKLLSLSRGSKASSAPNAPTFEVGDTAVTCGTITVRREAAFESETIVEIGEVGTAVEIVEIGEGRRLKVRVKETLGWISSRTLKNTPLITKVPIQIFRVGDTAATSSTVTLRMQEELGSEIIEEIAAGTPVEIIEVGSGRRLNVRAKEATGWISSRTEHHKALIVLTDATISGPLTPVAVPIEAAMPSEASDDQATASTASPASNVSSPGLCVPAELSSSASTVASSTDAGSHKERRVVPKIHAKAKAKSAGNGNTTHKSKSKAGKSPTTTEDKNDKNTRRARRWSKDEHIVAIDVVRIRFPADGAKRPTSKVS